MLGILAIRLLLALPLPGDLAGIPDPELEVQFCQHSLEPACLPAGFHPHAHLPSLVRELTVELLCFLAVLESSFLEFSAVRIDKRNLLKARVVIASYNQHIGSLSPEPFGWASTTKFTRG